AAFTVSNSGTITTTVPTAATTGAITVTTLDGTATSAASFTITAFTLQVNKQGTGSGTVSSNDASINCGSTCSASLNPGTRVTMTATPAADSRFGGWGGACSGTAACVVTMNSAQTVSATFTAALSFVPVTPCRVADTRNANGAFGGPFLPGGTPRGFVVSNSACNIPAMSQAFPLNVTVLR